MDILSSRFDWTPASEASIEVDPSSVDPERIGHLRSLGFNRVSFGVQSLDPAVLQAVRRPQQPQSVGEIIKISLEYGFSVGVDLMCGLPNQDRKSVLESLKMVTEWEVQRVALFAYAHLPELKPNQALFNPSTLPDSLERIQTQLAGRSLLLSEGFQMVGMDHFARPGDPLYSAPKIHRNFMGYTTQSATHMIGLGPSAISQVNDVYWQNPSKLAHWYKEQDGVRGHVMSNEDKIRSHFIEQAMCQLRVDLNPQIRRKYASSIERLGQLAQTDGVSMNNTLVRIHEPMMARLVAQAFDAYGGAGQFSSAM
jgi:oxygen-independent coproporphyrinogen-3 oxidase